jgi:hypothetical protein
VSRPGAAQLVGQAGVWLAWTVALFGLWRLLVGGSTLELDVAGLVIAAPAAAATRLVWVSSGLGGAPGLLRLAAAWTVPGMIVVDFGVLAWLLMRDLARGRRPHGSFRVRPVSGRTGELSAGTAAWITVAASISPNAMVVDVDRRRGEVLLHDMLVLEASESPA